MKLLRTVLKFGVGILILIFLIRWIGYSTIISTLSRIQLIYIPFILLFYFIAEMLGAINFYILVVPLKNKIPYMRYLRYYFTSWSIGYFVPGKLGELSIVYFLEKEGITLGRGTMLYLLNKMISFGTVMIIVAFGLFTYFAHVQAIRYVILLVIFGLGFLFFAFHPLGRDLIKRYILRSYAKKFEGFSKTFLFFVENEKMTLFVNYFITIGKWVFQCFVVYFVFHALGSSVSYLNVFLIHAIVSVISVIPITIAGLGIKEGSAVFLYQLVGESTAVTADAYLIMLFMFYTVAVVIMGYNLFARKEKR